MTKEKAEKNLEAAKKREEAAKLRSLVASQKDNAAAHLRQSQKPAYAGQAEICTGKAAQFESIADKNLATAKRLEAEADLLEAD
ncbi:MAG: hypothetical protein PHQ00_00095 [Phycisphaerae bacterium]|nr:hypothetical protein [Phycisphaerae bacterium]